ncbi:PQQ-dependent sugar dehydrogenase [Geodermatophilus sp. URMC 64]
MITNGGTAPRSLPQALRAGLLRIGLVAAVVLGALVVVPVTAQAALPAGFAVRDMPSGQSDVLTDFAFLPDGSYFTIGKNGRVAWASAAGAARTLATLPVVTTQDLGLVGLAVAPDYATSKRIYLARTLLVNNAWTMRLASFTVTGSPEPTGIGTERVIWDLPNGSDVHATTGIVAAADGTLWVSIGDSADFRFVDPLALRALDINTGYGKLLHVLPDGRGVPSNPYYDAANPSSFKSRVYASGFRSPFRLSLDPTTGGPILGDVGWNTWEEVNLIRPGASYGWPCWEGNTQTPGYKDLAGCQGVGNSAPLWTYPHGPLGTSVTGGIVYTGSAYPAAYQGAYFFGDYAAGRVYTLRYDSQGVLARQPEAGGFGTGNGAPVRFAAHPANGDIVYADIGGAVLKRLSYAAGNRAPTASAVFTTDPATRTVAFDGRGSSDLDGDALTYRWEFGDGATATGAQASHQYPDATVRTGRLTVTDAQGATGTTTFTVAPANNVPVISLTAPPATRQFAVGEAVQAGATATDAEDGPLDVTWSVVLVHCSGGYCHNHPGETFTGPTFDRPFDDHGDDTRLEINVAATDSAGVRTQQAFTAAPRLRTLTIVASTPAAITVNGAARATAQVTAGARVSVIAPVVASDNVATFDRWSDGAARERTQVMPDADLTLTATYLTPIDRRYNGEAALRTLLGAPTAPEAGDAAVRWRTYAKGRMYWSPRAGAHEVHGSILTDYLAVGGHVKLGEPLTDERTTPDGVGRYNHFALQNASVYWSPSTGAHAVYGDIATLWKAMGFERSPHGYPKTDELSTPNGRGRYNTFQNGGIYWLPGLGARSVHGAIYQEWGALRWESGILGFPTTSETRTPDGLGRFNHFEGGSVYWTARTGAHEVHGAIRTRWSQLGWERSYLGYPTSDEFAIPGGRRANFERGYITWTAATGVVTDRRY